MLVLDGAMDTVVATVLVICVPIVGVGAAPDSGAACGVTAANSGPENLNLEAVSFPSRPSFSMPLSDFLHRCLQEKICSDCFLVRMIKRLFGNRNTIGFSLIYRVHRVMDNGPKVGAGEPNVQRNDQFSILFLKCR